MLCIYSVDLFMWSLLISDSEKQLINPINVLSAEKESNCRGSHFKISSLIFLILLFIFEICLGYSALRYFSYSICSLVDILFLKIVCLPNLVISNIPLLK